MAWKSVVLTKDSFDDAGQSATADRIFYVESDAPVLAHAALAADDGNGNAIPSASASYGTGRQFCRVKTRSVERLSPTQFRVTVRYEDPTSGEAAGTTDLLALPARVTHYIRGDMEPYFLDVYDSPVVNSAFEPFSDFPTRLQPQVSYTISKYITAIQKASIEAVVNKTNSAAVEFNNRTHAADTLLMADAQFETEGEIYRATMNVLYKPSQWFDGGLDVGFSEMVDGELVPITVYSKELGSHVTVARPWPLNPDGSKKAPGQPPDVKTWSPYNAVDWSGVPLV